MVTGRSVLPFLVFNTILLAGFIAAGVWWAFFALWLLPMATWFPLVTRLRNIAEHACVEGSDADPFRAARTTRAAWWERAFIAPYWVNFHAEHHLFMHVPCWKLPALHRAVRARPQAAGMEVAPGYVEVLKTATRRIIRLATGWGIVSVLGCALASEGRDFFRPSGSKGMDLRCSPMVAMVIGQTILHARAVNRECPVC